MLKTDEYGNVYIPFPSEAREVITLELLYEDYKVLREFYDETVEALKENPESAVHNANFAHENKFKQAFETLIHYYGGYVNG